MSIAIAMRRYGDISVLRILELGYAIFGIYMFTGSPLWPSGSTSGTPVEAVHDVEGDPWNYLILSAVYLVALLLALRRPRALRRALMADGLLAAILILTSASVLWSDAPDVVLRRVVALLGTSIFGVYLHLRFSTEQQLRLVCWALAIAGVYSLLRLDLGAATQGGFHGAFENKNSLGRMMALATIVLLVLYRTGRSRPLIVMLSLLSLGLVVLANSATGLVVIITLVTILPLLRMMARDFRLVVGLGSIAVLILGCATLVAASNLEAVTSVLGRDTTLTGRTGLWQYVVEMILRRPFLGYGYETFWLYELPWRLPVDEGAGWTAPNAHNGYLEVALALGLLGLLLLLAGLGRSMARAIRHLRIDEAPLGQWPALLLCFLLLYNMTEIATLNRNSLLWVLYVATVLSLAEARWAASPGFNPRLGPTNPPPQSKAHMRPQTLVGPR